MPGGGGGGGGAGGGRTVPLEIARLMSSEMREAAALEIPILASSGRLPVVTRCCSFCFSPRSVSSCSQCTQLATHS